MRPDSPPQDALAEELVRCIGRIRARGWCDGTSGNYSVTLDRDPLRLLITPSGADKGAIRSDELLVVGDDGFPVGAGIGKPSAETRIHVSLATLCGAEAILHTHSVWSTLLGEHFLDSGGFRLTGYEMLKGLSGVNSHEEQVLVPVIPNTQDMQAMAADVERVVRDNDRLWGFVIAGHGLYTWGRDLAEAHRHLEIFEFLLRVAGRRTSFAPLD
ncbi:MAG: methylthioribulose 1-phosphate dehydratase [bacterium]|nr:methylthioribulose 1-phosphate dehydratase [bacterium]